MLSELDSAAMATEIAYWPQTVGNSSDALPGYVVDRVFDDQWDNTGFYAIGLVNLQAGRTIVAIRGSQDKLDVISNAGLGVSQYLANRGQLIDYIGASILGMRITIAGHSLGGGLSQYLGYDAAREFPVFRDRLTVHTHNGLGGVAGIAKVHGTFEKSAIGEANFRNFRHPDDPVSRIGGQAGKVYLVGDAEPGQRGLFYAHANDRFLPRDGKSILATARPVADETFELTETLADLCPQLSKALAEILEHGEPAAGVGQIYGLLRRVPRGERATLARLVNAILPFRRLWQRSLGRVIKARRPRNSGLERG